MSIEPAGREHREVDWSSLLGRATVASEGGLTEIYMQAPSRADMILTFPSSHSDPLAKARDVLASLWQLDDAAFEFLTSLEKWPYGDDATLWQVIEDETSIRLCYMQSTVNDEQVVGFVRNGNEWQLQGFDPRFRG